MTDGSKVRWPGSAYDGAGDDLSAPVRQLLHDLRLLEKPGDEGRTNLLKTPQSLQVMTAGTTALSKAWAGLLGFFGGGGALLTALDGLGASGKDTPLQRAVFVASAAVMLAAVAVSIALIVRGDVAARAAASAAEYRARAEVATALLGSFRHGRPRRPSPPPPERKPEYILQRSSGEWEAVSRFAWKGKKLHAITASGADVDLCDVQVVLPAGPWRKAGRGAAPTASPQDTSAANGHRD
jgi:hypothetical protein